MMDFRIGHGYDIHRLGQGGRLVLGGVVVAEDVSAIAHSDGDVVIHAIVDAILGALAAGDIGEHFPDSDASHKGRASSFFLQEVKSKLLAGRWRIVNIDVMILAERPRLKAFKPQMKAFLENLLASGSVNIKAGTNEGCDAVGRGEAIAAHAVVLLARA